jgi:predicted ABC-type ATPase
MPSPTLYLFGGANGSGKTTFARAFLPHRAEAVRFLNADEFARGLSPFAPETVAVKAGRLLLGEVTECVRARQSFALESTLSGHTYVRLLRSACEAGFSIQLNYLWLPSAELAVRRVRQRVRKGGHSVPEADVRRRYGRSIQHLLADYLPLADGWWIWDNEQNPPQLLASRETHGIDFLSALLNAR